jgi:general stress protein 26
MQFDIRSAVRRAAHLATVAILLAVIGFAPAAAQEKPTAQPDRAKVLAAARAIIAPLTYCGLVTVDEAGQPQSRTMNPFPPDDDFVVWMATNTRSRKVEHIRKNARVTLFYSDLTKADGYVSITGRAVLIDDMKEILKRKRAYWDQAFPGLKNLTLIKVIPERIEVVNYKAGLTSDPETFRAASIPMSVK